MLDGLNWTPITMGICKGNIEIIKKLLHNGANLNLNLESCHSPLNEAINEDNIEIVTFLIENGADVNLIDSGLWTPLTFAINKGDLEIVRTLLQKGANPDMIAQNSPLNKAIFEENIEIMALNYLSNMVLIST